MNASTHERDAGYMSFGTMTDKVKLKAYGSEEIQDVDGNIIYIWAV